MQKGDKDLQAAKRDFSIR